MDLKVIKWAWRHYSLDAELFDSVQDAVRSSRYAEDMGEESLAYIEVIEPSGSRVLTSEEYDAIAIPIREAEDTAYDAAPKCTALVRLASPDEKHWATYEGYPVLADAERDAERFRTMLGDERVKVDLVPAKGGSGK